MPDISIVSGSLQLKSISSNTAENALQEDLKYLVIGASCVGGSKAHELSLGLIFAETSIMTTTHLFFNGLSCSDTKTKSETTVILIHAYPLNKNMWVDQIEVLKKDFRVLALDIRGFGKSELKFPYTLENIVDDVINLMNFQKINQAIIVGLSMGGFVALRAIERNPERFNALILADTKSEPDSDEAKLGRYKGLVKIDKEGVNEFTDSFIKNALSKETMAEKPMMYEQVSSIAKENKKEGVAAGLLALTSRTDTTAGLSKIKVPTLIIQGEFDSVIPMEAAVTLNEKIKGSKLVVIPGVGHLSNLEDPVAFNRALIDFFERTVELDLRCLKNLEEMQTILQEE